eukprot:6213522-Pleurochrysis_carterae.AAC.1
MVLMKSIGRLSTCSMSANGATHYPNYSSIPATLPSAVKPTIPTLPPASKPSRNASFSPNLSPHARPSRTLAP